MGDGVADRCGAEHVRILAENWITISLRVCESLEYHIRTMSKNEAAVTAADKELLSWTRRSNAGLNELPDGLDAFFDFQGPNVA